MPWRRGTAPSVSPVPPQRGTTGTPKRLAILTISATCSVLAGSTTASGTWSAHLCTGNGAGTRARCSPGGLVRQQMLRSEDLLELLEDPVIEATPTATLTEPTSMPSDSASSSWMSTTSIARGSPAALSGRSDHGHALTSVSTSSRRPAPSGGR